MTNIKYQREAKIVGYVDFIFSILNLMGCLILTGIFLFTVFAITSLSRKLDKEKYEDQSPMYASLLWAVLGLYCFLHCIQVFASVKLIKATHPTRQAKEAYHFALFWRNFSITLFFFLLIFFILAVYSDAMDLWTYLAVCLLVRFTFLLVGAGYTAVLGAAADRGYNPIS